MSPIPNNNDYIWACIECWSWNMDYGRCGPHEREEAGADSLPQELYMTYGAYLEAWEGGQASLTQNPDLRLDVFANLMTHPSSDLHQSGFICFICRIWTPDTARHRPCNRFTTRESADYPPDQAATYIAWLSRLQYIHYRHHNPDPTLLCKEKLLRHKGLGFVCHVCRDWCSDGQYHRPCPWITVIEGVFTDFNIAMPRPSNPRPLDPSPSCP